MLIFRQDARKKDRPIRSRKTVVSLAKQRQVGIFELYTINPEYMLLHFPANVNTKHRVGADVVIVVPTTSLPDDWRGGIPYGTRINFTTAGELVYIFAPETEENMLPAHS